MNPNTRRILLSILIAAALILTLAVVATLFRENLEDRALPTPTPQVTPSPTPTPEPSPTPQISPEISPTPTPEISPAN